MKRFMLVAVAVSAAANAAQDSTADRAEFCRAAVVHVGKILPPAKNGKIPATCIAGWAGGPDIFVTVWGEPFPQEEKAIVEAISGDPKLAKSTVWLSNEFEAGQRPPRGYEIKDGKAKKRGK